jgi:short subunit dehydrogenase-like uncharacterized protein
MRETHGGQNRHPARRSDRCVPLSRAFLSLAQEPLSGFTGVLIARYLNSHPDFKAGRFTFALAARSSTKCSGVFKTLNIHPNVPFRQLDVLDAESVRVAVRSTHVVINAIGPYWRWGKLVARCARLDILNVPF